MEPEDFEVWDSEDAEEEADEMVKVEVNTEESVDDSVAASDFPLGIIPRNLSMDKTAATEE